MAVATRLEEQENPLVEGLERQPVHPTTLVIFGATGDLAHRKLLPALYNLAHEGSLPERFNLIGTSRSEKTHEDFRAEMKDSIQKYSRTPPKPEVLDALLDRAKYIPGVFDDPSVYETLGKTLAEFDEEAEIVFNRVFYLSTAPEFFPVIVKALGEHNLDHTPDTETRVVIEKPFGYDLASARKLNEEVLSVFAEPQVFRIDHYLGKETVQNIMAFRFANTMFEPVWNRNYIDHVQITAAEDIGIGTRAGYYDGAGALRDLVQNHMMELLANVCMEPPTSFDAEKVRDEKVKVIEAIRPPTSEEVPKMAVRTQYARGRSAGRPTPRPRPTRRCAWR
jgi:glucose-6-phosphate 1-dehydrogenase